MDGARHALLGYLYQFIGVCSLRAAATAFEPQLTSTLLADVRAGVLHHEMLNSDAVISLDKNGSDELVAIQFKHSGDPSAHVTKLELIEIIHGLEMTRREAAKQQQTVARYFLVTNRELSPEAEALATHRGGQCPPQLLLPSWSKQGRARTAAKQKVRRPNATEKLLAHYKDSATDAAAAWWAVLKDLTCYEGITFEFGRERLREYASAHGVLPGDLDAGLDRLIGALVGKTSTGSVDVSEAWLKEHLLQNSCAARLRFPREGADHIIDRCRAHLATTLELTTALGEQQLVRRGVQSSLANESAQRTVVFVFGDGGVGKSTEACRHLREAEQVSIYLRANTASEVAVGEAFHHRWSDKQTPSMSSHPLNDVEARLAVANPNTPRTLLVAIDGVDEDARHHPDRKRAVQALVQRFWAASESAGARSTLLVCCRPRHVSSRGVREQMIADWLGGDNPDAFRDLFGFVEVCDFDDGELADAAGALGAEPEERLSARLRPRVLADSARSGALMIAPEILDSLRHPVVWGLYAVQDPTVRSRILDAESAALDSLAARFIDRFLRKCNDRGLGNSDHLHGALTAVAAATTTPPPYSRVELWSRACAGHLSESDARTFHDEATGYGLIRPDSETQWLWRHGFVADHLRRQAGVGR